MAYGNLKADNLIYNDSGTDVVVPLETVAGKAPLASPTFTGTVAIPNISDLEAAVTLNTAKTGNATHTGDVTGATALTIAADAVNGTKIADDAIDSEHYVDGSIDTAHIADDAVTAAKLADAINTDIDSRSPKASPTFTGTVTAPIIDIDGAYKQTVKTITQSATPTVDLALGNYFTLTQNANVTSWTFSNAPASRSFSFVIELANVTYSTAWTLASGTVKWPADTAPTLAASKTHLIIFVTDDGGTTYRASSLADYTT